MDTLGNIIADVVKNAEAANLPKDGDYYNEDGLLYCGKCHTPKQTLWKSHNMVLNGMCRCESEKYKAEKEEERRQREAFERMMRASQIRRDCFSDDFYRRMNFDADNGKAPEAIKAARYYVDNWERFRSENKGLMFLGTVGTGKTFAACCIANAVIDKGFSAKVATTGELLRAADNFNTRDIAFDIIGSVDLLVIDDFGTQRNSEHNSELLFEIIDKRYKAAKPLIITSNLSIEDIKSARDLSLKRIYDRMIEMCSCPIPPVVLNGNSLRRGISREKHNSQNDTQKNAPKAVKPPEPSPKLFL